MIGKEMFTDEQFNAQAKLILGIADRHEFGLEDIKGHYEVSEKTCPNYDVDLYKKQYIGG